MPTRPPVFGARQQAQQRRDYDRERSQEPWRKWYHTARWLALRKQQLGKQPLCAECMKDNRLTPATDCDHIVPHRGDEELFWSEANLNSLCHACHARKTGQGR